MSPDSVQWCYDETNTCKKYGTQHTELNSLAVMQIKWADFHSAAGARFHFC